MKLGITSNDAPQFPFAVTSSRLTKQVYVCTRDVGVALRADLAVQMSMMIHQAVSETKHDSHIFALCDGMNVTCSASDALALAMALYDQAHAALTLWRPTLGEEAGVS